MNKLTSVITSILSMAIIFCLGCNNRSIPKNYVPINYTYISDKKECKRVFENIATKWGHHKDLIPCYYYNKELMSEILESQSCFINMDVAEAVKIFGTPSLDWPSSIRYNIPVKCTSLDTLTRITSSLILWHNDNSKITRISKSKGVVLY